MGAGVIPFAQKDGAVHFLFQTTFSGRKAGHLIDFGGGLGIGEDHRETAIREFIEESETMYFSDDVQRCYLTLEKVRQQTMLVEALFNETLDAHPDWVCRRASANPLRPKDWKTFFVEFPYRDIAVINRQWENDTVGRFKKPRRLFWVEGTELLHIYATEPERLWKRVRQLENASATIQAILTEKAGH